MTLGLKRQILWFVLQNTLNSGILTINPFCILILIGEQKEYFFSHFTPETKYVLYISSILYPFPGPTHRQPPLSYMSSTFIFG